MGVGDSVGDFDTGDALGVNVGEDVDTDNGEGTVCLPPNRLKIIFSLKEM
jgi:hypothetical protein